MGDTQEKKLFKNTALNMNQKFKKNVPERLSPNWLILTMKLLKSVMIRRLKSNNTLSNNSKNNNNSNNNSSNKSSSSNNRLKRNMMFVFLKDKSVKLRSNVVLRN